MNPLVQIDVAGNMAGIMSVALLSLLLVFFFVTLLHCYARWFLGRGRALPAVLVVPPVVVGSHRLLILRHLLNMDGVIETGDRAPLAKGLDPRVLSCIPVFVFEEEGRGDCGMECAICLSLFVKGEKGRRLMSCGHAFHVGCIDMWLHSHTTCPVCRAPAMCNGNDVVVDVISEDREIDVGESDRRVRDESEIEVEGRDLEGGSSCTRKLLLSDQVE